MRYHTVSSHEFLMVWSCMILLVQSTLTDNTHGPRQCCLTGSATCQENKLTKWLIIFEQRAYYSLVRCKQRASESISPWQETPPRNSAVQLQPVLHFSSKFAPSYRQNKVHAIKRRNMSVCTVCMYICSFKLPWFKMAGSSLQGYANPEFMILPYVRQETGLLSIGRVRLRGIGKWVFASPTAHSYEGSSPEVR